MICASLDVGGGNNNNKFAWCLWKSTWLVEWAACECERRPPHYKEEESRNAQSLELRMCCTRVFSLGVVLSRCCGSVWCEGVCLC